MLLKKATKVTTETKEVEVELPRYAVGNYDYSDSFTRIQEDGQRDSVDIQEIRGKKIELEVENVRLVRIIGEHPSNWEFYLGTEDQAALRRQYRGALKSAQKRLAEMWFREFGEPWLDPRRT